MRRVYLMLFLLTSYAGLAQSLRTVAVPEAQQGYTHQEIFDDNELKDRESLQQKTSGTNAVIFTEDFSNGFSGQGTNGAWSTSGDQAAALWEYRGPNTTPDVTVGSRGNYAGSQTPINSPTASNGFMIFDSDYLDNNGIGVAPSPHIGYLTSPTIDLTGYTGGQLIFSFSQYLREHYTAFRVQASINNGTTWNTIYTMPSVGVGSSTSTSSEADFVIPGTVAGYANVKFRFMFDGTTGSATNSGYYYWMVDDVKIEESLPNNLVLMNMPRPRIFFDQDRLFAIYHQVPEEFASPINFDMRVLNFGTEDQTNTVITADIYDNDVVNGPVVQTATSSPVFLPASSPDSLLDIITAAPLPEGNYKAVFTASSDSVESAPADNVDSMYFAITDSVFARDNGRITGTLSNGNWIGIDGALAHTYMQRYDAGDSTTPNFWVNSISVRVSPATDTTSGIYLVPMLLDTLYDPASPLTDVQTFTYWQFVDHLPPNNLDSANGPIGRWWTLPVRKTDGTRYYVTSAAEEVSAAIQINGGTQTNRVYIGIDNTVQLSQAGLMYIETEGLYSFGTRNLAIRMNVEIDTSSINVSTRPDVKSTGLRLLQNAPNPFNDMTRISYEMDMAMKNVSVQVYDLTGREVFRAEQGNQSAGKYTIDFNATGLNSGIYFYKLVTDRAVLTKKMILTK